MKRFDVLTILSVWVLINMLTVAGWAEMDQPSLGADFYLERGMTYYEKGQYDQAITDFNKAIEMNPRYAEAYYYRGIVHGKQGQMDKCWSDYYKAIEIDPKLAMAYLHHGACLVLLGDMGGMQRGGIADLETDFPGLGMKISYFSDSPEKDLATVFIYNRGLANISNGVASELIEQEFERSISDIYNAERQGFYSKLRKRTRTIATLGSYEGGVEALWASFSYLLEGDPVISHLYLTAVNNHFIKIRYTYSEAFGSEVHRTLSRFLDDIAVMIVRGRSAKKKMSYYREHPDQAGIKKRECRSLMMKAGRDMDMRSLRAIRSDYECVVADRVVGQSRIKE